jgi:two-component system NarL family sensor kinase
MGSRDERWAMAQFAVSGLVAVVIVLVLVLVAFGRTGRDEAIDSAKEITQIGAHGVVAPVLTRAVLDGDRRATERLDRAIRMSLLREPVLRVVVWDPSGRIVYSTQRGAAGTRVRPNAEMRRALRTGTTQSKVDDPTGSGGTSSGDTRLLDVYEPITVAGGRRLIVQSCRRLDSVSADSRALLTAFAPYLVGGVLLLQLVNLPLALRLIRRVRAARRKEEELLQRAVAASDRERRRLATDLHNGVVQDLAGMSMSLAAVARTADIRGDGTTAARLDEVAAESRRTTRVLRHVLVDIYPPNLERTGLVPALTDLLETVRRRGIEVAGDLPPELDLPPDVAALVFRVVHEALRNVVDHAQASRVELRIEHTADDELLVHVADNGRGFEPADLPTPNGHLGLALMSDLVEQARGRLAVASAPGAGTVIRARIPQ